MGYVSFHRHRHLVVNSCFYTFRAARLKISSLAPDAVFFPVTISVLRAQTGIIALAWAYPSFSRGLPTWLRKKSSLDTTPCFPHLFSVCIFSQPLSLLRASGSFRPKTNRFILPAPALRYPAISDTCALLRWPPSPLPAAVIVPALFSVQPPNLESVC